MAVALDVATGFAAASGSHTNSAAGNAIIVAGSALGASNSITNVTYGAATLSLLGYIRSNNGTVGGIALYGKIGGLPTGSNTVTVTGGPAQWCGAATYTGAGSFGTAVTAFGSASSGSAVVTGTTTDGIVVAGISYGASGTFTATSPASLLWSELIDSNSGAGNGMMENQTSAGGGGSSTIAWSNNTGPDFWGQVAVEIIPPGGTITGAGKRLITVQSVGKSSLW